MSGGILGYHNVHLRGYDDDAQTVKLHNQWRGWAPGNEVIVSYAIANQIFSAGFIATHPAVPVPPSPIDPAQPYLDWIQPAVSYMLSRHAANDHPRAKAEALQIASTTQVWSSQL